jgi:hypothetical protein
MEEMKNTYTALHGIPYEKDHLGDLDVDVR